MSTTDLYVPAGQDRLRRRIRVEGVVPLDRKVAPQDTGGRLLVFEHTDVGKGGPPRHLHYEQEEWLYAIKGEFIVEIGDARLLPKPGDSVLAPRNVPHGWAHPSDEPGTLLLLAQPAGTLEAFFQRISQEPLAWDDLARLYEAHGMKLLGEPIAVD